MRRFFLASVGGGGPVNLVSLGGISRLLMRDAITVLAAIVGFVGILSLVLWPLRAILQSAKVRGLSKLGWVSLWLLAFIFGGVTASLLVRNTAPAYSSTTFFSVLLIVAGVLPIWLLYALFRHRIRGLPELQSRPNSVAFELGKRFRAFQSRSK